LITSHGRPLRKLRIQLLDACNYRCQYCMPEHASFMSSKQWLSPDEIYSIASKLVDHGVDELRLTGGEPLLRPEFIEIAQKLSDLKVKKYGLTTNAETLDQFLPDIKKYTQLQSFNISIDSLDPDNFKRITKNGNLDKVLNGLHQALSMGYSVKVNAVLMRGINDHEWESFVNFSKNTGISVRFLELMKIGPMEHEYQEHFMPASQLIQTIREKHDLAPIDVPKDNTSFDYQLSNGAKIGFIASETQSFCGQCSRLRLTANGELRPCLFKDTGSSLRNLSDREFSKTVNEVAQLKPTARIESIEQPMYAIGG